MRWHSRPASARKWVQRSTVRPCSRASVAIRLTTSRVASGSSPEVGSSRNSTSGSCKRARANATRLRCPVERPCAFSPARPAMSKRSSMSRACRSASTRDIPRIRAGITTFSRSVRRSSRPAVSVSTPVRRRTASPSATGSRPSTRLVPASGRRTPLSNRTVVVLPAPLGPSSATTSPGATSNVSWSTAGRLANERVSPLVSIAACAIPTSVPRRDRGPARRGRMDFLPPLIPCRYICGLPRIEVPMSRVRNAALAGALLVGALQGGVLAGRPAAAASGGPTTPTSPAARRQGVHIDHETAKAAARRYARSLPGPQSGPSRSPSAVCVGASPISDPAGDVPGGQLDAVSYQLAFDCGAPNWTFSVTTAAPWADSALYTFDYFADVDGDLSNNCFGLDRDVFGFWDGGHLVAVVGALTPSCQFVPVASAVISRPNSTRVDMVFSNAALSDPSSLTWYGEISDSPSLAPDDFPDSGGWMVDGPCPTASSSDGTSRYYVADVDAGKAGAALRRAGLRDVKARGGSILTFGGDRGKAARALATVGQRATIAPDYVRAPADTPNDPGFAFQWNFGTFAGSNGVNAEAAWTGTHGSSSIKVAVLDTGADTAHPELTGKLVDPWNVVSGTTDVTDSQGHGTAVSGLIAGVTNNASGLASLGWDTQVMPIKVGNGLFFDSDIILGLDRAIAHGADVVNLSLGGDC